MDPTNAPSAAGESHPYLGPALVQHLREAFRTLWHATGPALLAAFIAYWAIYFATEGLVRRRQGGLSGRDERDLRVVALLAAIVTWAMAQSRQYLWEHYRDWVVVLAALLAAVLIGLLWGMHHRSAKVSRHRLGCLVTEAGLRQLTPREFELACAELFRSLGYRVRVTPAQSDRGADLVVTKGGVSGIVECKHFLGDRRVTGPTVQKLLGAKEYYGATEAYLVTSGELTAAAWDVARKGSHLQVWRREDLARKVYQAVSREEEAQGEVDPDCP
jgi:HJR/Mrr/RecB family endonuclease